MINIYVELNHLMGELVLITFNYIIFYKKVKILYQVKLVAVIILYDMSDDAGLLNTTRSKWSRCCSMFCTLHMIHHPSHRIEASQQNPKFGLHIHVSHWSQTWPSRWTQGGRQSIVIKHLGLEVNQKAKEDYKLRKLLLSRRSNRPPRDRSRHEKGFGGWSTRPAMARDAPDFNLPDELLAVIPVDPYDQLDLARRIASLAITSRVSHLEGEADRLRQMINDRDLVIEDLQGKIARLDSLVQVSDARLRDMTEENVSGFDVDSSASTCVVVRLGLIVPLCLFEG